MKVTLLYTRVLGKSDSLAPDPSYYAPFTERFHRTYLQFKPEIEHELLVCNCGVTSGADHAFDDIATSQTYYSGTGWDVGAYLSEGSKVESDLVYCMAAPVYFWRPGWLEPIVQAASKHGPGIYGPMASNENSPHIRTACIALHPKILRDYPNAANSHHDCCLIESSAGGLSDWATQLGYPVMMVTESEELKSDKWRTPPNIFRRGNQTNCLVWDRHTDLYAAADPVMRAALETAANGKA